MSASGGRTAAVLFSTTAGCNRHGIDPCQYLADVLCDGTILFQTFGFSDDMPLYQRELATLRRTIDRELASNP
jgi:hypothetical protein